MNIVYLNQSVIVFAAAQRQVGQEEVIKNPSEEELDSIIDDCLSKREVKITLFSDNPAHLWEMFLKKFRVIPAAGGLVHNDEVDQYLFINRFGKWDLPKGWIEAGESASQAALREVREETGLFDVSLGAFLTTTYHVYQQKGVLHLKQTHWYAMHTTQTAVRPQQEEDITEARWFVREEFVQVLCGTYPNVRDVVGVYLESAR